MNCGVACWHHLRKRSIDGAPIISPRHWCAHCALLADSRPVVRVVASGRRAYALTLTMSAWPRRRWNCITRQPHCSTPQRAKLSLTAPPVVIARSAHFSGLGPACAQSTSSSQGTNGPHHLECSNVLLSTKWRCRTSLRMSGRSAWCPCAALRIKCGACMCRHARGCRKRRLSRHGLHPSRSPRMGASRISTDLFDSESHRGNQPPAANNAAVAPK